MKKFTKILALMLALVMVISIFAACKKDKEPVDTGSETTTAEPETTTKERDNTVKIANQDQFDALVKELNENPENSKGKTYVLYRDITLQLGWDPSPSSAYGKLVSPDGIGAFPGIGEFYGIFDGQDHVITSVYRVNEDTAVTAMGGFINKLNGGTVKNLTINNAYILDAVGSATAVGGLVGVVNGAGAVIENVTVNTNVYAANNGAVNVGGIVGAVEAGNFTMNNATFGGKAGNVGADLAIPSSSTSAVLGQLIGNAGSNTITVTNCKANGELIGNAGATQNPYVGAGSALTESGNTSAPSTTGIVEMTEYKIYTADELYAVAAYDDTFEGKTIRLIEDITLNEDGAAEPISWTGLTEFKGTFDGNGRKLMNLYIEAADAANVGFIETLNGGTVENLAVFGSNIVYSSDTVPANIGFIGKALSGTVELAYFGLSITATGTAASKVGGIIGSTDGATAAVEVKDIVFNGEITTAAGTSDAIVANATAQCAISDVISISATCPMDVAAPRVNAFKGKQDGSATPNTWEEVVIPTADIEDLDKNNTTYVSKVVATLIKSFVPLVPDTSWYQPDVDEFNISTAEELLGLSKLTQPTYVMNGEEYVLDQYGLKTVDTLGVDFSGKTINIITDIDLNLNWDATTNVSAGNVVTVAKTPLNIWEPIPSFKGTINGGGHRISGMYAKVDFVSVTDANFDWGGFIVELKNGNINNLIIDNSVAHFVNIGEDKEGHSTTTSVGGFIAHCVDSTLDTIYADIDTWVEDIGRVSLAGMIGSLDTEHYEMRHPVNGVTQEGAYVGEVKNLVYAGSVGRITLDSNGDKRWNVPNECDGTFSAAGVIGANWGAGGLSNIVNIETENISMIGTLYMPQISAGGCDNSFVMQDTLSKNYNFGMTVNNYTVYSDPIAGMRWTELNKDGLTQTSAIWKTDVQIGDVANDLTNRYVTAPDATDTYTAENWAAITIANGAKVTTPILLPKTVVDMLNANSAYAPAS